VPTASFEPVPESAREVKRFVGACLADQAVPDPAMAVLLVSALATNAIVQSRLTFAVSVEVTPTGCVQIAVSDLSAVLPTPHQADVDDTNAIMLTMIATIATRWGIDTTLGGKRAWFELCGGTVCGEHTEA
jgi:hypothetical protein